MLKEKLMEDLKEAMKEKQNLRKNVVQMIRAAILQVEKDKQIELDDNQILEIIAKEAKKANYNLVLPTGMVISGGEDITESVVKNIK